ncbi:MAG: hypothetical protein EZS28_000607 [Streblomastix strix]|uniref:Uncharacterized protein n=1 Tax=Streblomastix strix TaxID=222440 RepID=A0A5J4XAN8_9EUKA|nr:MAG: hypothetical protein EZS28_000607 [Streblomastix strix]
MNEWKKGNIIAGEDYDEMPNGEIMGRYAKKLLKSGSQICSPHNKHHEALHSVQKVKQNKKQVVSTELLEDEEDWEEWSASSTSEESSSSSSSLSQSEDEKKKQKEKKEKKKLKDKEKKDANNLVQNKQGKEANDSLSDYQKQSQTDKKELAIEKSQNNTIGNQIQNPQVEQMKHRAKKYVVFNFINMRLEEMLLSYNHGEGEGEDQKIHLIDFDNSFLQNHV